MLKHIPQECVQSWPLSSSGLKVQAKSLGTDQARSRVDTGSTTSCLQSYWFGHSCDSHYYWMKPNVNTHTKSRRFVTVTLWHEWRNGNRQREPLHLRCMLRNKAIRPSWLVQRASIGVCQPEINGVGEAFLRMRKRRRPPGEVPSHPKLNLKPRTRAAMEKPATAHAS